MKLIAIMPVRNEDWILGFSLRAVLQWVDAVVVLNHASIDLTGEITKRVACENSPGRVIPVHTESPIWYEMKHRNAMLEWARCYDATHIAIVDADEVLTANLVPTIRQTIEATCQAYEIVQLPWVCLAPHSANGRQPRYYSSGRWYDNWVSMAFRDMPGTHWAARDGYDFHHRHPMGRPCHERRPVQQSPFSTEHQGGLMHYQFVSERRLKAKQYLYQLTERQRWPDREPIPVVRERYSATVRDSDPAKVATSPMPAEWLAGYEPLLEHLHVDREPWQLEQCRAMLAAQPSLAAGLDSFGLEL